jgi:hypothetical protein
MKSCTDIEQSKKLAEILPIESADMCYANDGTAIKIDANSYSVRYSMWKDCVVEIIPCWSLAALLDILPNEIITDNRFACYYQINIRKYDSGSNITLYQIAYGNNRGSSGSWHDIINTGEKEHLIDACFQMLLKLNEYKWL